MTSAPEAPGTARPGGPRLAAVALAVGAILAVGVWRGAVGPRVDEPEFSGLTMGTTYSVKVDADLDAAARAGVRTAVEATLQRVNDLMSTYDSTSEISRFNRHRSTEPFAASAELVAVLEMARQVSEGSGGAFDATVAPLVDAWGFGPEIRLGPTPDDAELEEIGRHVGYRRVIVDVPNGTVAKTDPLTVVDLSAIAKGYGVDRVAAALAALGLGSFLVEVGGELSARGTRRDGRPWRVGVERPAVGSTRLHAALDLVDEAIATSGDYRNYYEEGGRRYAHVIDPRTGRPVPSRDASVSVTHAQAAVADAWATALVVLGPEAGYEVAAREGVAALFVTRSDGGFASLATPAFQARAGGFEEMDDR